MPKAGSAPGRDIRTTLVHADIRLVIDRTVTQVRDRIAEHGLVVFAGAGVSMDPPSRVPGWFALNGMILDALKHRVTRYLGRDPIWLDAVIKGLIARRDARRFPPEYQAQIMEEQVGESYFRALANVDVAQRNAAHLSIAALAHAGVLRAVVTTNFDRLIESALKARGVAFRVHIDADGFRGLRDVGAGAPDEPQVIPVIKIHGSVESTTSMIDTLQQRIRGRKEHLEALLTERLGRHFVLYAGFSAADLNHDPDYLRLRQSAQASPGALFVQFPGSELEPGARALLEAYGTRGLRIEARLGECFSALSRALGVDHPGEPELVDSDPVATVTSRLEAWADSLEPYEAINALTALLDAGGEEDAAFHVLHRTWESRRAADSEGEHYARYQYNFARHCLEGGEMEYEETPQNFLRAFDIVPQASAGFALWNLYRARVAEFLPYLMDARAGARDPGDPRLEGDRTLVLALGAVIYRWTEAARDVIEAGNRQFDFGDVPRAVRLWTAAARLAARSDDPGLAFDLFDHCDAWVRYLGDDTSSAELYLAQGIANFERGDMGSAGWNYERAVPVLRRYQRWPSLIEALIEAFRYDVAEGRIEQAVQLLGEANGRISKGYEIYYPHLGLAVAEYHLAVEAWDRARRELQNCRPWAEQTHNEWAISTIDAQLRRIDARVGDG